MDFSPRSTGDCPHRSRALIPYPLDSTFVQCLKAALHERDPKRFFPHLNRELAKPGDISALDRFFRLIPRMPDLYRHHHLNYDEALNEALRRIDKQLTNFECHWDTDTDTIIRWRFIKWLNGKLRYTVKDLYRYDARIREKELLSLDCSTPIQRDPPPSSLGEHLSTAPLQGLTLSGVDQMIETLQNQNTRRQGLLVELYIEQDPDCALQGCHARKSTWLNCQEVARKMLLRLQGGKVGKLAPEKRLSLNNSEKLN